MSAAVASMPHLLRPLWLLALLLLPALWWLWHRSALNDTPWKRIVDRHLLPSLLHEEPRARSTAAWLFGLSYLLAVLALAGPAWRQPVVLYAQQAPLVVVEDLSSHMLVADLPPSRLLRARLKIQQLIELRKGGQMGLVAYAGEAFTVSPLTEDAHSLSDLVVALTPDTMPVDGQRADRGLRVATDLLTQAGFTRGTILLLSDSADAAAQAAASAARAKGYEVDVLGVGSQAGAPLPNSDGTFAEDAAGAMHVVRLDATTLQALAQAGGGRYAQLTSTDDDLDALGVLDAVAPSAASRVSTESVSWNDAGPFLLLLLLPLVALGFRRGWLAIVLVTLMAMPSHRAEAGPESAWNGLWQRADQRADSALRKGDARTAAALATTPGQRAAAAYRSGDFAGAERAWSTLDTADAGYNRGNALAQLGRYPDAISAYRKALQLQPSMPDAQANLRLVEQLLKQQKQQQQDQKDQKQNPQQDHQGHEQGQQGQQGGQQQQQKKQDQASQQAAGQQASQQQKSAQNPSRKDQPSQDQNQAQPKTASQEADVGSQPAPDKKKQALADAAERRALEQALQKKSQEKQSQGTPERKPVAESNAQREQRDATEALLQRVPDDPGALLRRKFALEYARRQQEGNP